MKFENLKEKRFGKLVVLSLAPKTKNRSTLWLCKCDCGSQVVVKNKNLIEGIVSDCGCLSKKGYSVNQKIARLTLIKELPACRGRKWECICDCGNKLVVKESLIRNGVIKSCGCLQKEYKKKGNLIHGYNKSRLQRIYQGMKARCYNQNHIYYIRYGGRGITICDEWLGKDGLKNFGNWAIKNGYNENLTIDRIDNNGNYSPQNCKWSTCLEQQNNTRYNYLIEYKGEILTLSQTAKKYNINISTLYNRLRKWKNIEKAIETPIHTEKQRYKNKKSGLCATLLLNNHLTIRHKLLML